MSWEYSKIDQNVIARWKKLGDLGESIAEILLTKARFDNIRNLNKEHSNKVYADLFAERKGQAYVISVKARNKYENTGRLNSRYKLGENCYEKAKIAENEYNAKAAWITIVVDIDNKIYNAYFGLLITLGGNTGVLMTLGATKSCECLAHCEKLEKISITEKDFLKLRNIYQKR